MLSKDVFWYFERNLNPAFSIRLLLDSKSTTSTIAPTSLQKWASLDPTFPKPLRTIFLFSIELESYLNSF